MKRSDRGLLLVVLLTVFFTPAVLGPPGEAAGAEELRQDTTHLDFIRTDAVRTFMDREVAVENYIVRKGDYIWKILRERGHGPGARLMHWSKVLQTLNPAVEDLDKIYPGQRLQIPLGFLRQMDTGREKETAFSTKAHEVKPGESLTGILRHEFHLPDRFINKAITRVQELNPEIQDPDLIHPGQRLIIPLYGLAEVREKTVPTTTEEVKPTPAPAPGWIPAQPEKAKEEETEVPDGAGGPKEVVVDIRKPKHAATGAPVEEEGPDTLVKTRMASALSPEDQRVQVLAETLMALNVALGGRSINSGRHFLPLRGEGQVTLKAESFPLLEFPSGDNVFLDLYDRLPASLEEAIRLNWESRYSVVDVRETDNFRTVWQRLLQRLTGWEQWLSREPLFIQEPIEIAVNGDWVLTPSNPQPGQGTVFVINLLNDARERTDKAMQAYLNGQGVRVVDVQLRGQLESAQVMAPVDGSGFRPKPTAFTTTVATGQEAVTTFLDFLGQEYQKEASLPLYPGEKREVTITVRAGLYFQRNGDSYLVDFKLLSPPILRLLEERGLKVLVIDPASTGSQVFKEMIENLGLTSENSYGFLVSERDPGRNIRLSIAGDLIRDGENSYLLTPTPVGTFLADYLATKGVRVLSYGNP